MEARIHFNYDCYGIHGHGHDTTLRPTTFDGYVCASYLAFYLYRWICSAPIFIWIPYLLACFWSLGVVIIRRDISGSFFLLSSSLCIPELMCAGVRVFYGSVLSVFVWGFLSLSPPPKLSPLSFAISILCLSLIYALGSKSLIGCFFLGGLLFLR